MRNDANHIALRVIRAVLESARSCEVEIGDTRVMCTVPPMTVAPWPAEIMGLTEAVDGPWPGRAVVDCAWTKGACRFEVDIYRWTSGSYRDDLCLNVVTDQGREVVFVNVSNELKKAEDGTTVRPGVRFYVTKRKSHVAEEIVERLNTGLREVLADSGLPIIGKNTAELCQIEVPSGALSIPPEVVFRRLVQLALLKLDFIDRRRSAQRGAPLVDLTEWLTPAQVAGVPDDVDDDELELGAGRNYWGAGFTEASRLEAFKHGNFWEMGYKRTSTKPAAKKAWKCFDGIKAGDHLAIKGLGGKHDLVVHYVGEVQTIDREAGRLQLSRLDVPLYKGKGPTGKGAGSWHDTLVPVVRGDIIEQIFGEVPSVVTTGPGPQPGAANLPLNLILYGPPGTGKTYHLSKELVPKFRRTITQADWLSELADDLTWVEAIAVALANLDGKATVPQLAGHPLLATKYSSSSIAGKIQPRLWSTLQTHTVASSKTVNYANRRDPAYFDKDEDSVWHLVGALPDDLKAAATRLKVGASSKTFDDFTFVTFHQAYAYEDFIEGIRPRVDDGTEDDGDIRYVLEHGVFLKACQEALRLAGFVGKLHDFCALSKDAREKQFANAPHYALFIDEINRGNVARIFGELITLLEDDKRLGEPNELIVQLPYSKTRFGVPPNLHVIGTMNTADRSIEALDTALRRRFAFQELGPDPDELDEIVLDVDIRVADMLRAINRRIEVLYDRDHAIGHAFFMPLLEDPTFERLKRIFKQKIIPLLQEYFFGDWGKIGLVLGKEFVRRKETPTGKVFAAFPHDDQELLGAKPCWDLADVEKLSHLEFQGIYL